MRTALRTSSALRWVANDDNVLPLLSNLRTLAWVMQSASAFASQDTTALASPTTIADWLWSYWTGGRAVLQRLLMDLADREASFERSFALSELDGPDVSAFDDRPEQLPLTLNARNRIEFRHDLASDWARYQRLKEITDDIPRWAALAVQPLWISALRMFGQFLLRLLAPVDLVA